MPSAGEKRFATRNKMKEFGIDTEVINQMIKFFEENPDEAHLGTRDDGSIVIRLPSPPLGTQVEVQAWYDKFLIPFFTPDKVSLMGPYYKESVISMFQGFVSYFNPIKS